MSDRELLEAGLEALIPGFSPQAVERLLMYSQLLLEKNKVMNLTAVTDPCAVVTRHFLDCAALAPYVGAGQRVLDVGTGAGFPGLPLAILTDGSFTLLDAQRKRIDFLQEVIAALGLTNCTAVHARAEEFAKAQRGAYELVVSRAVAPLGILCELALPMVGTGGVFLAMKAADCGEEVAAASNAVRLLGGEEAEIFPYAVPQDGVARALIRIRKIAETPDSYPRRFKKIASNPL